MKNESLMIQLLQILSNASSYHPGPKDDYSSVHLFFAYWFGRRRCGSVRHSVTVLRLAKVFCA